MTTKLCCCVFAILGLGSWAKADQKPAAFTFDSDQVGEPAKGFEVGRTGKGRPGKWTVKAEKGAPSEPNVLVQSDDDDTDNRFPVAFTGPALKDLRLSVRCKAVSGKVDQACGLVFRLRDADNYYVTRANALEDNVRLYHVVRGNRRQLASWSGKVASGQWHELAVEAKGEELQVFFDGKKVIEAKDKTFADAGKFGVWTKADSITYFDNLTATPK
jgi:hypothetical protein